MLTCSEEYLATLRQLHDNNSPRMLPDRLGKHDDQELDFVVQNPAGEREYYQVAWTTSSRDTLARELKPLESIGDNFPKYLITTDPGDATVEGIRKVNATDWLLKTQEA